MHVDAFVGPERVDVERRDISDCKRGHFPFRPQPVQGGAPERVRGDDEIGLLSFQDAGKLVPEEGPKDPLHGASEAV